MFLYLDNMNTPKNSTKMGTPSTPIKCSPSIQNKDLDSIKGKITFCNNDPFKSPCISPYKGNKEPPYAPKRPKRRYNNVIISMDG